MASTSIGEYAVRVTGDSRQFTAEMNKVAEAAKATAISVKATSVEVHAVAGAGKNATFAFQQLALAVQDGASVFGTAGFSGAVRAAGNNLIQMASLINPLAGTFAAFAITGIQLVSDRFRGMGKEVAKAAEEIKNFTTIQDRVNIAGASREAVERVGEIKTVKSADQRIKELEKEDRIKGGTVADIDKEIAAAQRRIGEIQRNVIEKAVALDSQTSDTRPEFRRGREVAARNRIARERDTFLNTEGSEGGAYGARGFRGMTKADLENVAKERASIEEATKRRMELSASEPGRQKELQEMYAKRAQLQLKESLDAEIEAFGKGGTAHAKTDEIARKRAVKFEDERQKLIAGSNRDMMAAEEQAAARRRAYDPFSSAAGFGSSSAAEALARARAVPKEQTDIDRQVLAIQQKALSELSEIRLNTKAKAAPAVVEEFD